MDALGGNAGILCELRQSLHFRDANTAVLVARGVRELAWAGPARDSTLMAWSIDHSKVRSDADSFRVELSMWPAPGAELVLRTTTLVLVVGNVPGLSDAPPDYLDLDRRAFPMAVASWESTIDICGVASLNTPV